MNKVEFNKKIADKMEISQKEANTVLNVIADIITDALEENDSVTFCGLGTFKMKEVKQKAERIGRNPATGEPITIPAQPKKLVPTFKVKKTYIEEMTQEI